MGLMQFLGLKPATWKTPTETDIHDNFLRTFSNYVTHMSVEELWEQQPHLRTVVDFMARQVRSVSIHAFTRKEDNSRVRLRAKESTVAAMCNKANEAETMSQLIGGSVYDLSLYDEFIWVVEDSVYGPPQLYRIPPTWVMQYRWKSPWQLEELLIKDDSTGVPLAIPGHRVVRYHGYSPKTTKHGNTPINALRDILNEQIEAAAYRNQLWKQGPRLNGYITRPKDANWDNDARKRFKRAWQAQYSGRGSGAGGTPILEDGMELKPWHLSAKEEQFVEVSKLSLQTVASIYHIPPTMVGLLDNANYSNVREFRKSLYGEALGPIFKLLEETLNLFVLPALDSIDGEDVYVEFNLDEKLRASFEERAAVTQQSVGGPFMTVNEARAQNNLPSVPGGDELLRPLNLGTANEEEEPPGEEPTTTEVES